MEQSRQTVESHSRGDVEQLTREKHKFRDKISTALDQEDDPLAFYDQFVQWTLNNYGENDPHSGLLELLEETTRIFKDDATYKADLRYLKLWVLYARQVEKPAPVYGFLMANDIGTKYSALYEEYANVLEQDGLRSEAEAVYRTGIKRNIRAVERLKNRFRDFQSRTASSSSQPAPAIIPPPKPTGMNSVDALRRNPLKNHNSNLTLSSVSSPNSASSRYALMLAPPVPGKRPENLRFNLSLLFTEEGVEYSIQEARARFMGLLGKTWGPPPNAKASTSSSGSVRFAEQSGESTVRSSARAHLTVPSEGHAEDMTVTIHSRDAMGARRKSFMMNEPTVTICTKEALADVFGMYNSPEKTSRLAHVAGSKHAPLRKVEPITPASRQPPQAPANNENANNLNARTPTPAFRPFVDENLRKENATPAAPKFKPFVDSDSSNRPFVTPDVVGRRVLSTKDSLTPAANSNENATKNVLKAPASLKAVSDEHNMGSVFSKVFTPASTKPPVRKSTVEDPSQVPTQNQAVSSPTAETEPINVFKVTALVDPNQSTPFRVFSRPPAQSGDAFNKPDTLTPFSNAKGSGHLPTSPSPLSINTRKPTWDTDVIEIEDDEEEGTGQLLEPHSSSGNAESPAVDGEAYEDGDSYQEVPLGGRFGRFNVMTPITERTFEFTTSTRASTAGTPTAQSSTFHRDKQFSQQDEHYAIEAAERLVAELKEEEEEEGGDPLAQTSFDESESSFASDEQLKRPFHLPNDSPSKRPEDHFTDVMDDFQEKTGTLSLLDAMTISSQFKPSNPCNPFDPPIVSTLLSLIPSDNDYHHFPDQEAKLLEGLRKFAKRARKTSGNTTNSTGVFDSTSFPLTLAGHRFDVSETLGEGGFGTVFKATDLGTPRDGEEDDDDEPAMVALKVVKPRNLWEYHVLRSLHSRLPSHLRQSVVLPQALFAFRDESFLVLDLCPQGTLLNIVNNAGKAGVAQQGACLDELLVMFFAIELLRLLEGTHGAGFIHGDLKIDNCLLRLEDVPGGASAWSSLYQPSGEGGWSCKGIKLIDFGRTIDTRLFPNGQTFIAEWATDDRDCLEIRQGRPWTYQTDYFGLAGIIYCMLFGKYIQSSSVTTVSTGVERYKIATPFKRYWQTDLWSRLFDLLLNPCLIRNGHLPLCEELGELRGEMERWLQSNCNRTSITLRGLLRKVEVSAWSS